MNEEKKMTFEERLNELNLLVSKIESGDLPLEEAMSLTEKGKKILASLEEDLAKAKAAKIVTMTPINVDEIPTTIVLIK